MNEETRSLYNKYRPKRFSDVVGQKIPLKTMINALRSGKLSSSYLLSGQRGIGKTTTGRIFAKALMCETGIEDRNEYCDGCGECDSCRAFSANESSNFIEIDAGANGGIDSIRELKNMLNMPPIGSRRKVVLLDEAHALTRDAKSALLKILEEPPNDAVFILSTTEPMKIYQTIRSRCTWLQFEPLTVTEISGRLAEIAGMEGRRITDSAIESIALSVDGSMRDAINVLGSVFTYTSEHPKDEVTKNDVNDFLLKDDPNKIGDLIEFISNRNKGMCIGFAEREAITDKKALIEELVQVMQIALIISERDIECATRMRISEPMISKASKISSSFDSGTIMRMIDSLEHDLWKFNIDNLNKSYILSETLLRMMRFTDDNTGNGNNSSERETASSSSFSKFAKAMMTAQTKSLETLISLRDEFKRYIDDDSRKRNESPDTASTNIAEFNVGTAYAHDDHDVPDF